MIFATKLHTIVIAEIELGEITMKVPLAAMLIDAFHAALEHAVEAFDGICMNIPAHIFISFVADALMAREMTAEREIMAAFVGHHRGFLRNIGLDDRDNIGGACSLDMERANLPAIAINERKHRIFVAIATTLDRAIFAADKSFVGFYNATGSAERRKIAGAEGFANAVR